MKKLILIFTFVVLGVALFAQKQTINNGETGLSVRTKLNTMFGQLYSNIVNIQFSTDGVSGWHDTYSEGDNFFRISRDVGATWGVAIPLSNSLVVQFSADNSNWNFAYSVTDNYIRYSSDNGATWTPGISFQAGGGTVTSVATGLGLSGGTITGSGTIVLDTASVSVISRQRATNTFQPKGNYLTTFSETDPVFGAHTTKNIANGTGYLKNNGSGAWSWDNSAYSLYNHDHNSTYEPLISKSTGYAKWNGSAWTFANETYSLNSHNHSGTYEPVVSAGTTSQYFRGDKTWQTLNTTAVAEGTNQYYTDARSRGAISLTTTGSSGAATYNSSTGALNIPQYAGSGMTYPGAGIPLSTGSAWGTSITDNSTNWNTAYTNRITSLTTTGSSGAATLSSNTLNVPNYTLAGLGGEPAITKSTGYAKWNGSAWTFANETYSLNSHNHSGTYEPSNANIQSHISGDGDVSASNEIQSLTYTAATRALDITGGGTGVYLPTATGSNSGLMSLTDYSKLANVEANATYNPGWYLYYNGGNYGLVAKGSYMNFVAGSGISLTPSVTGGNGSLTIASTGSMTYPGAGIPLSTGSAWGTSITDNSTNWNTAYTDRLKWDGGATGLTASTGRTSLGATTIGSNMFTLTNPSAISFPRFNADNTVSALSAAAFVTAIGADASTSNEIQSLAFTASTRALDITGGGTGTTLPLFTSTTAGLTPLSGGGTTNFLRADGTWAAAGGSSQWTTDANGITYSNSVGIGIASSGSNQLSVSGASKSYGLFIGGSNQVAAAAINTDAVNSVAVYGQSSAPSGSGTGGSFLSSSSSGIGVQAQGGLIDLKLTGSGAISFVEKASSPATPASSSMYVYGKTDNFIYAKNDNGTEWILNGEAINAIGNLNTTTSEYWYEGSIITTTLTGNSTINVWNIPEGKTSQIRVTQDGTGSRTLTLYLYSDAGSTLLTKKTFGTNTAIKATASSVTKIIYQRFGSTVDVSYIQD